MIAALRGARAGLVWLGAAWVALTIVWRIARGEVVVLSGHAAPVVRLVAIVIVFLASCAEKLKPAEQRPASSESQDGGELSPGTGTGVGAPVVSEPVVVNEPVVVVQEFPDNLDDAAIETALKWTRRRELWRSFEGQADASSLADGAPPGAAAARLVAAVEQHRARAGRGEAETVGTLTQLLDAAEGVPLYDAWLAGHLWGHARGLSPAPAGLLGRIERHLRVVQAVAQGEASTGPIEFSAWRSKAGPPAGWSGLRVPAGLAAAAREAFKKGVDAGTWESGGVAVLTVAQGEVVLVRRGGEAKLGVGAGLRLRRLDVVRAPAGARLRHERFGELVVPAGGEVTAWNAAEWLTADGEQSVAARVQAALLGESAALVELEGALPLTHAAIRAAVAGKPEAPGAAGLRLLLTGFDE